MYLSDIKKIILDWGVECISKDFNKTDMKKDISLLGLDSIDLVEFCEYLEFKFSMKVDFEWIMEFESLNDLVDEIKLNLHN